MHQNAMHESYVGISPSLLWGQLHAQEVLIWCLSAAVVSLTSVSIHLWSDLLFQQPEMVDCLTSAAAVKSDA